MVASSGAGCAVSPLASGLDVGLRVDSGLGVGDIFGDGITTDAWGIVCCGARVELIGSFGRLVKNNAMNVARVAAPIMLIANQISPVRCGCWYLRRGEALAEEVSI